MATIQFKAKPETIYNMDGTVAYRRVKVPTLARSHCDMHAFRSHKKYGSYANSDLFPGMLKRIKAERTGGYIRLDRVPDGVTVDVSGYLACVSFEV